MKRQFSRASASAIAAISSARDRPARMAHQRLVMQPRSASQASSGGSSSGRAR